MGDSTNDDKDFLNGPGETTRSTDTQNNATGGMNTRQFKPSITLHDLKSDARFQDLEPSAPKNLASFQCVKLSKAKNIPSKRALFSMAQTNGAAKELFFYSGVLDKEKRLNELYTFRPAKRMWQKIVPLVEKVMPPQNIASDLVLRDTSKELPPDADQPANTVEKSDKKKPAPKKAPPPRKGAANKGKDAAASTNLYDGLSLISYAHHGCQSIINSMHEFDLNQKKWKTVSPSGDFPAPSHGHTMLYYKPEDAIIFFGGCSFEGIQNAFNSVYMCLVSGPPQPKQKKKPKKKKKITHLWQQVHFQDEDVQPEPRYGHVAEWLDQHNMIIHGGTNGDKNFDDVWIFNVPTRKWIPVDTTAESDEHCPTGGRYHHASCIIGRTLWISFGVPFNSDVYSLDLPESLTASTSEEGNTPSEQQTNAKAQWNRYILTGESIPSRRWGHNMVMYSKGAKDQLPSFILMFGSNIIGKYHGDMWALTDPKIAVQVDTEE